MNDATHTPRTPEDDAAVEAQLDRLVGAVTDDTANSVYPSVLPRLATKATPADVKAAVDYALRPGAPVVTDQARELRDPHATGLPGADCTDQRCGHG